MKKEAEEIGVCVFGDRSRLQVTCASVNAGLFDFGSYLVSDERLFMQKSTVRRKRQWKQAGESGSGHERDERSCNRTR